MRRRLVLLLFLLYVALWTGWAPVHAALDLKPTVILISLDGWRWDYAQKYPSPNLRRLIARGVSAALIPSFPSKTFPNHYTIVTGLYPGHHGIVANTIKDPPTGRRLTMSNRKEVQDAMWWGGEPLWVTVERAGQAAAPLFWPGSEAPIFGQRPRFWQEFDDRVSGDDRVDRVLSWLDLPASVRPTFLTLYFSEVDGAGHEHGPESVAVRDAVRRVDSYIGRLMRGLSRRRIDDSVNVVVVSDHGMAESNSQRVVVLDDYVSLDGVEVVDLNPTVGLFPSPAREEAVYRALVKAHPNLKMYRRAETPVHWHYRDHPRIPPLVGVVDEGWQVLRRSAVDPQRRQNEPESIGVHGYDPTEAVTMRGVFVAAGPAFKSRVTVPPFENIQIYGALAEILGVTPAANDGDPKFARTLLK